VQNVLDTRLPFKLEDIRILAAAIMAGDGKITKATLRIAI